LAHKQLLSAKYEVGELIAKSPLYMGKGHPGSGQLVLHVSKDMGWSKSELYSCMKFWEEVETSGKAMEGYIEDFGWELGASWTKLKQRLNGGMPRVKPARGEDKTWQATKTDRFRAVRFTAKKIGKVWTEKDQAKVERLLNVGLLRAQEH
jgi:hypothetical protein